MNSTPLPKDLIPAQLSLDAPSSPKNHTVRIIGMLAMGLFTVSSLFTILAKPQAFASLFNANRDLAMNSDLLMVGAKVKKPISGPISSPISGPLPGLTRVPKPRVTDFIAYPSITPKVTVTPGPLTGTVVPLMTPPPLQTTDKRVFLTSTTYTGNLGGIAGADQKCQESAKTASISGSWKAWVSDISTPVGSRFTRTSGKYTLLDGSVIAQGWADLTDGTILKSINLTELKTVPNYQSCVWTSTEVTGNFTPQYANMTGCNGYTIADKNYSMCGHNGAVNAEWTKWSTEMCSASHPLFCFEQ